VTPTTPSAVTRYPLALALAALAPLSVSAGPPLFNFTAITLQEGSGFELGDDRRRILTLEHYSLWNWGDLYTFYDRTRNDDDGDLSHYGEISPRLSLAPLGLTTRTPWTRDLLLAGTYEYGSDGYHAWLGGAGVTWDLPPFSHLETDIYYRDSHGLDGATWQLTLVWALPFTTGPLHWTLDGYLDLRGAEGDSHADANFNPQLKLDLGRLAGWPGHLHTGVEYYHWQHKYGVAGVRERVLAPLVQLRFSL
jgi:nucleoside-specific outer membrane channel protein Tsx